MKFSIYQIDAFTDKLFGGNPAAVVPLQTWISDELMQQISMENNVSDTGFFVPSSTPGIDFDIRWFTPCNEINLCGHATLASAYLLFNYLGFKKQTVQFNSQSGQLFVTKSNDLLTMDFPSWKPKPLNKTDLPFLKVTLGINEITGLYQHRDLIVEVANETIVKNCKPDFTLMKKHFDKIIITARGDSADFVSRFFASANGIDEDPVTGSAHSQLIPFWSERLGKSSLKALQLSARGGELWCEQLNEERVLISGKCVFYMEGTITI